MSKKARSEGARVAALVRSCGSPYFVADVELDDNEIDVFTAADSCRKTLGKKVQVSYMVISAGVEQLIIVANIHDSKEGLYSAKDWITASVTGITGGEHELLEDSTDMVAKVVVKADTPFKLKDLVRSNAFEALRKAGQIEEQDESEDEYYFF